MSIVTSFASAAYTQAATMIGAETVTLNGTDYSAIVAEVNDSKEFGDVGFELTKSLTVVLPVSSLPSTSLLKKAASCRGVSFRVDSVSTGATFATIRLETETRA